MLFGDSEQMGRWLSSFGPRLRIEKMERQWLEQSQDTEEAKFNKRRMAPMSGRI